MRSPLAWSRVADDRWVAVVDLPDGPPERAVLRLDGIATVHEVRLDGTLVATGSSMFQRHAVDVTHLLRGTRAEVEVRELPLAEHLATVPRSPRARWRTALVDDHRLRWVRTSLLGRMPGLCTGPPVRGPWRPAWLEVGPPEEQVQVRAVLDGDDGVVEVLVRGAAPDGPPLVVSCSGREAVLDGGRARLRLPDVERWWPHTHGTPVLHEVVVARREQVLDRRRVGFRSVRNADPDSLDLWVNDVPVWVRGAVWTPGDLAALDEAVALGLDLVRVPGWAHYEGEAFHARCDELGLLVWQDLALTTADLPLADDGFRALLEAEVAAETAALVGHPSTVVVCGSSEHDQQAVYAGSPDAAAAAARLADALRPHVDPALDAVWVPSSPSSPGGHRATRPDLGVAHWFGVGAYLGAPDRARVERVRFASECLALAHAPEPFVEGGVQRDHGADCDFADVSAHYRREHGLDSGEVAAHVLGEWRRPASVNRGAVLLWLRDLEPGSGWGLLDHTGTPKPAAAAVAQVLRPRAAWFVDEGLGGLRLCLADDGPDGGEVEVVLVLRPAGAGAPETVRWCGALPARGHLELDVEEVLGRWVDVTWSHRFGPPWVASVEARVRFDGGSVVTACWRERGGHGARVAP